MRVMDWANGEVAVMSELVVYACANFNLGVRRNPKGVSDSKSDILPCAPSQALTY